MTTPLVDEDPWQAVAEAEARAAAAERHAAETEIRYRTAMLENWERAQCRIDALAREFADLAAMNPVALTFCGSDLRGFWVYLLWDEDGERPVYIGQSSNLLSRLGDHVTDPEKGPRMHRVTLVRCKTKAEMCRTERALIALLRPELNDRFSPVVTARPVQSRYSDAPRRVWAGQRHD